MGDEIKDSIADIEDKIDSEDYKSVETPQGVAIG